MIVRQFRLMFGLAAAWAGVFAQSSAAQDPRQEEAETAIRASIDKFNACWKAEDGVSMVEEVLSDNAFALARAPSEEAEQALVLNKSKYLEGFKQHVWKANLRKHEHKIKSITVWGPLAYELGVITDVDSEGVERSADVMNVFAQEDSGWRLVFSTSPELFKKGGLAAPVAVRDAKAAAKADETVSRKEDQRAVRKLAREFVATFRSEKPTPFERFEELLADDVVAVQQTGEVIEGRQNLVNYYREHTAELRKKAEEVKLSWHGMSVKAVGDGAVVFGKLGISAKKKEDGQIMHLEVWETLVLRKDGTRWRVIEEASTAVPQENSARSAPRQ